MTDISFKSSIYLHNKILKWEGMDDKESFVENCKKYPNNESLKYYKENPIKYSFNNFGFRTPDDFNDEDEGNVFLGCSMTMGLGHHLENTWSYKVNKEVGGKFWNLSQSGCGVQTDHRLLLGWKDILKIKNVFHLTYPHPRFEFFDKKEFIHLNSWNENIPDYQKKFYLEALSSKNYSEYVHSVYISAIERLCQEIGCNYYNLRGQDIGKVVDDWSQWYKMEDKYLQSRDLRHPTVEIYTYIYKKFMEKYNGFFEPSYWVTSK
jgi:hypothetical protein